MSAIPIFLKDAVAYQNWVRSTHLYAPFRESHLKTKLAFYAFMRELDTTSGWDLRSEWEKHLRRRSDFMEQNAPSHYPAIAILEFNQPLDSKPTYLYFRDVAKWYHKMQLICLRNAVTRVRK